MTETLSFFATAARHTETLLADELRAVLAAAGAGTTEGDAGLAASVSERRGGVAFEGPLSVAYRACLWSRVAQRVLLPLTEFEAHDADELYAGVRGVSWSEHLDVNGTLAVDFVAVKSSLLHTQFGAQKVKDAIVDQFRDATGVRPSVDLVHPDLRVNVFVQRDVATVSVDLSGDSLHRRGYRTPGEQVAAPLKETLAAAILLRAGWPAVAVAGGSVVDPLCGSGTLPIEAALMAADSPPGLLREYWGFLGWKGHDAAAWQAVLAEAGERRSAALARLSPAGPLAFGYDRDPRAVELARGNASRAGVASLVRLERRELSELAPPTESAAPAVPGLVVANPPYGHRITHGPQDPDVGAAYERLGERLRTLFGGWKAAVLAPDVETGKRLGLRAKRSNRFMNGPLPVILLRIDVPHDAAAWRPKPVPDPFPAAGAARSATGAAQATGDAAHATTSALSPSAEQFANRLRKNVRHWSRLMRRAGVSCFRVYDADLPDYNVAVDVYERWVHVQEYAAPPEIDADKAAARLAEAMAIIPDVLELPAADVFLKVRERQRGTSQYQRQASEEEFHVVHEGDLAYLVNFTDYLDTGLFLPGREVRRLIGGLARGQRFLNLFGYTGAASVAAGKGGAASTTTVDLSERYLEWARRNLELNKLKAARNETVAADCLQWVTETEGQYELIYLDPPTFSNSKKMGRATFDVSRDHADLIRVVTRRLLSPGGILIFACNARRFTLDRDALAGDLVLEDLTRATLPPDFARSARGHHVWRITARI